ncbi:hypothetical protein MRX96_037159 [Rhipicephalus microplus]
MKESPADAEWNAKAMCVLHNFRMDAYTASEDSYCGPGYVDSVNLLGQWRSGQWQQQLVQTPWQLARTKAHNFA